MRFATGKSGSYVTYSFEGFENMYDTLDATGSLMVESEEIEDSDMTSIGFTVTDDVSTDTITEDIEPVEKTIGISRRRVRTISGLIFLSRTES